MFCLEESVTISHVVILGLTHASCATATLAATLAACVELGLLSMLCLHNGQVPIAFRQLECLFR